MECSYCGQDLAAYDPVVVERGVQDGASREGAFCNYGCLSAWIAESGAAEGACCRLDTD